MASAASIARRGTKIAAKVARRVAGGPDVRHGRDDVAAVGWDLGTCPNLESGFLRHADRYVRRRSHSVCRCVDEAAVDQSSPSSTRAARGPGRRARCSSVSARSARDREILRREVERAQEVWTTD